MNRILKNTQRLQGDWQERIGLVITGAVGVALNTGVIAALIYFLLALGSLMASPAAYSQAAPPSAAVRLEAGIEKENVDGDLNGAMSIYQKIAADASAPRDVRAKALLRLAGCDEKLGKQAKQVYEQIVHDYADQPAATQARTRLAAIKQQEHPAPAATMTARRIEWANLGRMGAGDTDGQRATFIGPDGNLYFGDVAGHNRRLIFALKNESNIQNEPNLLGYWTTKDFSMVALAFRTTADRPFILAEVKIDGTGYRELIRDDKGGIFGNNLDSVDVSWSWDNRFLALTPGFSNEGGRLILVDVGTGNYRELVRSDSDRLGSVRFSPDGQFIAYEATPAKSKEGTNRVYVVPVGSGEPQLVKEIFQQNTGKLCVLKDWTGDGRYLVTTEARQGKSALYLLPMKDGAANDTSEFVRFGDFDDARTTLSGSLVYQDHTATSTEVDAYLASIDSTGHIGSWQSLDLRGGLKPDNSFPWPSFSPDGTQIAYRAGGADPEQNDLVVRDLSTGRERVIYQSSNGMLTCQYSNKEPKIFCAFVARDGGNKTDLFTVDDKTGAVQTIASLDGVKAMTHYPEDGRTFYFLDWAFYFLDSAEKRFEVTRWDIVTHEQTVAVPGPRDGPSTDLPSFDGQWLLHSDGNGMSVKPITGGDRKIIVSGANGFWSLNDTTHDGKWAFFTAVDSNGKANLFRVPTTGGAPERVGGLPNAFFHPKLYLSGDGRKIMGVDAKHWKYDLWVLENFEPSVKK